VSVTKVQKTNQDLLMLAAGPTREASQELGRGLVAGKGDVALQVAHSLAPRQQIQQRGLAGARGAAGGKGKKRQAVKVQMGTGASAVGAYSCPVASMACQALQASVMPALFMQACIRTPSAYPICRGAATAAGKMIFQAKTEPAGRHKAQFTTQAWTEGSQGRAEAGDELTRAVISRGRM
jgi:hypothetical protein